MIPYHPVRLRVEDDLRRSRLTVFFRLVLVIPHLIWLYVWSWVFVVVVAFNWLATLFAGRTEDDVHNFNGRFLRYWTQIYAYVFLAANPWPRFSGRSVALRSLRRGSPTIMQEGRSVARGLP